MLEAFKHIEIRDNRDGQPRAYIENTRIRVQDIVKMHQRFGYSSQDIANELPVSLSQVHAALAYYFDNREAVYAMIKEDEDYADSLLDKPVHSISSQDRISTAPHDTVSS